MAIKKFKPDKEGEVVMYTGISQSACREIMVSQLSCWNYGGQLSVRRSTGRYRTSTLLPCERSCSRTRAFTSCSSTQSTTSWCVLPLTLPVSVADASHSKSFITTRRPARLFPQQFSSPSFGSSSTASRTCTTTGSSTATSSRPTSSSPPQDKSRLATSVWRDCIKSLFSLSTRATRSVVPLALSLSLTRLADCRYSLVSLTRTAPRRTPLHSRYRSMVNGLHLRRAARAATHVQGRGSQGRDWRRRKEGWGTVPARPDGEGHRGRGEH
mgnify:CR=1 FL=1